MVSPEHVNRRSEVMIVSSESGPPRLDLNLTPGRRGTFDSLDSDFNRRFYPRTARSSHDLFTQALDGMHMADFDSEWGAGRATARENNDRQGLADLIDFLRTTSPPSDFPSQSELPEKWRLLKKLRRPRTRARSLSPAPVVSKTSSGKSHIAISIPLEYCHVDPDSDWALAVFNATPPLPPTPPVRKSDDEPDNAAARPYASERKVTVLKTVSEKGTKRGTKGSVPPMTPYTTPPGSLRESSSTKERYSRMPSASSQRPSGSLDKGYHFGRVEGNLAQVANPNARKYRAMSSPKRPENISLPPRRSSAKISRLQTEKILSTQHLIDGNNDGSVQHNGGASDSNSVGPSVDTELSEPVVSSARSAKAYSMVSIVRPEMPSTTPIQSYITRPGSSDTAQTTLVGESVASRNDSTRTAPSIQRRKERVRSLKQRDMEALKATTKQVLQEDGEVTPRPRTCETAISSLRLPSRDGTFGPNSRFPPDSIAAKLSATNLANMAKAHKVSSHHGSHGTATKISDWQATQQTETPGCETAREEMTPEWEIAQETPAIDWEKKPPSVEMTEDQVTSVAASTRTFGNGNIRDSTLGSEPPRRWGSLHRTSWASSVPLLDRIGSFAPSEDSTTLVTEAGSSGLPPRRAPKSRVDSGALSQTDTDRLCSDSFSSYDSDNQEHTDTVNDDDQSIAGSIAAFPKPGSGAGPRLSAIMPVAEVVPSSPVGERWSASTLNSPMTVVELSYPPLDDDLTPRQSSMPVARLPAGKTNTAPPDIYRDQRQTNSNNRRKPATVDSSTGEAATLRSPNRSNEEDYVGLLNMSSRQLRNHYASLRSTRVNDLAHEMLLNQERLEMRIHRQERNQILFIERLQRCMSELQSLPDDPFPGPCPQDWTANDDEDNIYEGLRISRDARHEVRARKTTQPNTSNRPLQQHQPGPRHSSRRIMDVESVFDDFPDDFVEPQSEPQQQEVPKQSSTSRAMPRTVQGSRLQAVMATPIATRGGLDAMDPLIRELQLAARVSRASEYSYGVVSAGACGLCG
ncbi:hypothetical protein LX36DRAFT_689024 [Colletotrichum falcatum]|nr:hypothetical protein LX36DRAFT_689024 [Colletotrichum falcatum]